MALIVTYSTAFPPSDPQHVYVPVQVGRSARSERIVPQSASGGNTQGALTASASENVVDIYAQADCWFQIGAAPVAEAEGATSRFMASGERQQFWVETGDKISVIET